LYHLGYFLFFKFTYINVLYLQVLMTTVDSNSSKDVENYQSADQTVTRSRATPILIVGLLGFCVGLGVGIGVGAGIWKDSGSGCSSDALLLSGGEASCDASLQQHDDTLLTYVLSVGEYQIQRQQTDGEFVDVFVPKNSLPDVMPYVVNDVANGTLYENVLNTSMFLEDWSVLSSRANASAGQFAMPAYAAAKQCYADYELMSTNSSTSAKVPANAMVVFHDEDRVERLAHVYSVKEEPDQFVFTMLPVTDDEPTIMKEGQCHVYQNLSSPHFHHASTCLQYDAKWIVGDNKATGSGLTAFIKLGPLIDTAGVAVAGDLLAGGATDAATDAAADAASDVASDVASDGSADDAVSTGSTIVSDASSDMSMSSADTAFTDDSRGGGPGMGTVITGAGVAGAGIGTAIGLSQSPAPRPPGSPSPLPADVGL